MGNVNKLSFSIKDEILGEDLSPSNFTLPLLTEYAEQVQSFLRGNTRKDLAQVKTSIEKGSLALVADNTNGTLNDAADDYSALSQSQTISDIDPVRARIIELWQANARRHPKREYRLALGEGATEQIVTITAETDFKVERELWVEVELYAYGTIYDLGGKSKSNVHIELENGTTLKVETDAKVLVHDDENRLYRRQLLRIKAERKMGTKFLRNERLISFEHYSPSYDEGEFERIARKAKLAWGDVKSASKWVEELRGTGV
jgi:hypothetical protein